MHDFIKAPYYVAVKRVHACAYFYVVVLLKATLGGSVLLGPSSTFVFGEGPPLPPQK